MSAIDFIKARKGVVRTKVAETVRWNISGSTLFLDGQPVSGTVDWEHSRYLRKGNHTDFYAFLPGPPEVFYIMRDTSRVDYKEPPKVKWGMPIPVAEDDEEDE